MQGKNLFSKSLEALFSDDGELINRVLLLDAQASTTEEGDHMNLFLCQNWKQERICHQ